jgi:hypothetical protein
MPGMRPEGMSTGGAGGGCGGVGGGTESSSSNGSRTPGGSSAGHRIISLDSGTGSVGSSQKTEKKTFYSRIPPLGRSGSTDRKSTTANISSSNATIK